MGSLCAPSVLLIAFLIRPFTHLSLVPAEWCYQKQRTAATNSARMPNIIQAIMLELKGLA